MACIEYTTQTDSKVYKIKQDIDKCLDESKTGVSSEIVYQIIVCFYSRLFAVQNRNALINKIWEEELYKYITGIVQNKEQKMLAINGTHNHIHFFWDETYMLFMRLQTGVEHHFYHVVAINI